MKNNETEINARKDPIRSSNMFNDFLINITNNIGRCLILYANQ